MKRKAKVKVRKLWRINPRTRVKESKKLYSRKKKKRENHRIKSLLPKGNRPDYRD